MEPEAGKIQPPTAGIVVGRGTRKVSARRRTWNCTRANQEEQTPSVGNDMSVVNYTSKIKEIYDALGSIKMMVDKDEMVQVCLGGLAQRFGSFLTTVCMREKMSSFFELQTMLLVEENHTNASMRMHVNNKMPST